MNIRIPIAGINLSGNRRQLISWDIGDKKLYSNARPEPVDDATYDTWREALSASRIFWSDNSWDLQIYDPVSMIEETASQSNLEGILGNRERAESLRQARQTLEILWRTLNT